jgi:DNA modification methylase
LAGDNEIANLANDNSFLLAELLKEVSDKTDNLIGTGYTDSTLEDLLDSLTKSSEDGETDYQETEYQGDGGYYGEGGNNTENQETKEAVEDDFDLPEENEIKTDIVLGDLFEIGNHRLLCGDSTDKDSVGRLMNGEKADMVFTDPPYGMFLNTDYSGLSNSEGQSNKYDKVIGDNDDFSSDLIKTIFTCFSETKEIFIWGADYFAELLLDKNKGSWIVWDKRESEITGKNVDGRFGSMFELCWSKQKHKRLIARIMWAGMMGVKDDSKRVHPTQKPTHLAKWFFEKWGSVNDLVVDLYLGSGSTMVASHQLDRRCYGMELDPRYCQIIVERMIKLDPTLTIKKNGKPFVLGIQ